MQPSLETAGDEDDHDPGRFCRFHLCLGADRLRGGAVDVIACFRRLGFHRRRYRNPTNAFRGQVRSKRIAAAGVAPARRNACPAPSRRPSTRAATVFLPWNKTKTKLDSSGYACHQPAIVIDCARSFQLRAFLFSGAECASSRLSYFTLPWRGRFETMCRGEIKDLHAQKGGRLAPANRASAQRTALPTKQTNKRLACAAQPERRHATPRPCDLEGI